MNFPTNISIRINNKAEHDELVRGLRGWIRNLHENGEDATAFATILDRVRYHNDKGIAEKIPEAYVETGGRKIASGTFAEMYKLFQQEIAGHSARVILYQLDEDNLGYHPVQSRVTTPANRS